MPGFNPDNINIHDLAVEEPGQKQEVFFDQERAVTEKDLHQLKAMLETYRTRALDARHYWSPFAVQATAMGVLFPDKAGAVHISKDDCEKMEDYVRAWRTGTRPGAESDLSNIVMAIKMFHPERMRNIDNDHALLPDMETDLKTIKNSKSTDKTSTIAQKMMQIKMLFPEKKDTYSVNEMLWQEMKKELEKAREKPFLGLFAKLAMEMKILCPEKASELNLDENTWIRMEAVLDYYRDKKEWQLFASQSAAMKILAADQVNVTEQGLMINMRSPNLESESKQLPQNRKF